MSTSSPELERLRDVWTSVESGSGFTQAALAARSRTIAHLVPDAEPNGLSTPYVSQLLNTTQTRNPKRPQLVVLALSMSALVRDLGGVLLDDDRDLFVDRLQPILDELRVNPTTWADPEVPLPAQAENLVLRTQIERELDGAMNKTAFTVSIRGPLLTGKSTALARLAQRCRGRGIDVVDVSVSQLNPETVVDQADLFGQFAFSIGLADEPSTGPELSRAVEDWLRGRGRTALLIDDANAVIGAGGVSSSLVKTLYRHWGQKIARAGSDSPWRRLSLALASTYAPEVVGAAAIISTVTSLASMEVEGFYPAEVGGLVALYADHHEIALAVDIAELDDHPAIVALCDHYAGHPYLVHGRVAHWAAAHAGAKVKDLSELGDEAADLPPYEERFVDSQVRLCETVAKAKEYAGETTKVGDDDQKVTFAAPRAALRHIGVMDPHDDWTSPFVRTALPAALPASVLAPT